ncbi:RnfH family protein [Legionella tunisiensis]|uniref:RnfH family protein n=1 Tax=Legionella tunisiensis TaxID=1034944 RepID=UPI00030FD75D|nr:RnfH family protein [Legionella tunisiensis]
MVNVEIVYVAADQEVVQLKVSLQAGATVSDALKKSGILVAHPEIQTLSMGIFSKRVTMETALKPGDRLEIYRPLSLDPKEKRRQRAKAKK